jgi:hypothetical protein
VQDDLERAVRSVVPALNLEPKDFRLPDNFVRRAQRLEKPRPLSLNGIARQLVYLGTVDKTGYELLAQRAVELLTRPLRDACEHLIVAWADTSGRASAAAFEMSSQGELGPLLAMSWLPPEEWPEPMIDFAGAGELDRALARLEAVVRDQRASPDFDADFTRATRLVDLELRRHGGEGQSALGRPSGEAAGDAWRAWFERYARSVRSEWRRLGRGDGDEIAAVSPPTAQGPLTGMRVFLSYARPEATTLAWPVREALGALGAGVWFDLEQNPDPARLDAGLGDAIADCDAYVMCASDEFVERAGYATQEMAWAVEQSRQLRFLIVTTPDTILPTIVAGWPRIEIRGDDPQGLRARLADALTAPPAAAPAPAAPRRAPAGDPTDLPREADVDTMRLRAVHSRRHGEIDHQSFTDIVTRDADDRGAAEVRARLIDVGEGLDWSGTLADLDRWPDDTFVRDYRLRLASMRATAGTRWPLNGDVDHPTPVADDVEVLATRRVPLLDWRAQPGWADNERRYALRFHAGLLRYLEELLDRRVVGGLLAVPPSTLDEWAAELRERRRECVDGLVQMRVEGRLSWSEDPPFWDALLSAWLEVLTRTGSRWSDEPPPEAFLLLGASLHEVAGVAAQTAWCAARHGGLAIQSFELDLPRAEARIDVYATGPAGTRPAAPAAGERRMQLGLGPDGLVRLRWAGCDASRPAPDELAQAIRWRNG